MIAKVDSACLMGIEAATVQVEVSLAKGMPIFSIVGLPDAATREAKDRVIAATRNSGFDFPSRRLTVNLSPAELKKEGSAFDLAIAVGILLASETLVPKMWPRAVWLGELALDGTIQPVRGALAIVRSLSRHGIKTFVLPWRNADEVQFIEGIRLLPFNHFADVVHWLDGTAPAPELKRHSVWTPEASHSAIDLAEIKGQVVAKRALEIAAAGNHNLIMVGCPGTGKSMLAQALPSILPRWTLEEALDASQVHSLLNVTHRRSGILTERPFRAPHHSISSVALVGGGEIPCPGEISMAHNGVLFLDEFAEFHRDALETLRQPLEEGQVHVQRVRARASFPASFLLIAAMNPCPCGLRGHPKKECLCSEARIQRYLSKISAPLLDRMDLQVELAPLKTQELLSDGGNAEASSAVLKRVEAARRRQLARRQKEGLVVPYNAKLRGVDLRKYCALNPESRELLQTAVERLGLSARAFDRIRRVARTIADLAASETITTAHVAETLQYRALDRPVRSF